MAIIKNLSGGQEICLAVKADAYGHGAVSIARRAVELGVTYFGVARISEAELLRNAGIQQEILLFSACTEDEYPHICRLGIQPFLSDSESILALARVADASSPVKVHLKVDTGMGRLGMTEEHSLELAKRISDQKSLILEGVATHHPLSDDPDDDLAPVQTNALLEIRRTLEKHNIRPRFFHASNSGGLLYHLSSNSNMIRPGIAAYGYAPDPGGSAAIEQRGIELLPVMELQASVSFVKKVPAGAGISYGHMWHAPGERWIATVNCGYADGYPRLASGRARFEIEGRYYQQVGRVCMDQMMVDLGTDAGNVRRGSIVRIFGPGLEESAESIGAYAQTISYEQTCAISGRVPRVYRG